MERLKENAKALWDLVKGNLIYDLLKIPANYFLPWISGTLLIGIVVLHAYIKLILNRQASLQCCWLSEQLFS